MGAPPRQPYRTHQHQKPTMEGEPVTFTPLEEDNATLRYFAATEMKVHERGWSARPDLPPWNDQPLRRVPYSVRGQKTLSNEVSELWHSRSLFLPFLLHKTEEASFLFEPKSKAPASCVHPPLHRAPSQPWLDDVKRDPETTYATSCLSRLDDGMYDDKALAFRRRQEEDLAIASNRGLVPWHTQLGKLIKSVTS